MPRQLSRKQLNGNDFLFESIYYMYGSLLTIFSPLKYSLQYIDQIRFMLQHVTNIKEIF